VTPLEPGIERSDEFVVEGRLLTDVAGALGVEVLSTPAMIGMMERTARKLASANLPDGQLTVGFEVCVKHVGAAAKGATCTAHVRLREVLDERKLRFDVEVREGERTIGIGTHERRIVERAGFASG
jgi:predicted thioesterase